MRQLGRPAVGLVLGAVVGCDDGGGRFRDVSAESGITAATGPGLGVVCADFTGDAEAGMGIAIGDVDHDGRLDLFVTHLHNQTNTLYRGAAYDSFVDATDASGLGMTSYTTTGFGTALLDIDHDGDRVIELAPDDRRARLACGSALLAIGLLRHGLTRLPESARINNELAWLLATTPDADLRDGAQAVKFAERAVELTGGDSCNELDTLAAAYAEAGRYDEAITTAERALAIAKRTGPAELVTQLAERLEQLRARRRSP